MTGKEDRGVQFGIRVACAYVPAGHGEYRRALVGKAAGLGHKHFRVAASGLWASAKIWNEILALAAYRSITLASHLASRQVSAGHVLTSKLLEVP